MTAASQLCPACGHPSLDDLGALPPLRSGTFGGQPTHAAFEAGHLMRCRTCDLQFRNPSLPESELTKLYEDLPDTVWHSTEPRPYWPLALRLLERHAVNPSVLDVGCFCGDLLHWLPAKWSKSGIEPALAARKAAESRSIQLVGRTAEDLSAGEHEFGAVLAFDVIEHLTNPLPFLKQLQSALAPGGSLILFTGATDTWPYRLFRRHYWYGSFPEHVTFYSRDWFVWAAGQLGMTLTSCHYLSSESRRPLLWLKQLAQLSIYTLMQKLRESRVPEPVLHRLPLVGRAANWTSVPWSKQAADHLMVVLGPRI